MPRPLFDSPYIFGLHDPGGEHLMVQADRRGWIVFTVETGHNPADAGGFDFTPWAEQGFGVLCRINNGYGSAGTIPPFGRYVEFAQRVARFVAASQGCGLWVIGNEMNHEQEWPDRQPITPELYAACFRLCRNAIKALPGHGDDQVIVGAVAPWNVQTRYPGNSSGDWVRYFADILALLGEGGLDGIALHTYTHGADPGLITSGATMDAPFTDRHFHFQAYRDFLDAVPVALRHLPVYVTETDQDTPWLDENNGWVQAAFAEIQRWNQQAGAQQIRALVLYRWPPFDQWSIESKGGVQADLLAAMQHDYRWREGMPAVRPTAPTQPQQPEGDGVLIAQDWLNVRATPGGALRGMFRPGASVIVAGAPRESEGIRWRRVAGIGHTGEAVRGWAAARLADGTQLLAAPDKLPQLAAPFAGTWPITQAWGENPAAYARFAYEGAALLGHNGLDFGLPVGTPITAVDTGEVHEAGNDAAGFGWYVLLRHAWGESIYAHLRNVDVAVGQTVSRGARLGRSGNTGNSTGPHLHFAIRINPYRRGDGWGGYSDPLPYLPADCYKLPDYMQVGGDEQAQAEQKGGDAAGLLALIRAAADRAEIPAALLASLVLAESSFNPQARSPVGAMGLCQIMPATWAEWAGRAGAADPWNPGDNLAVGAAYLSWLLSRLGGDTKRALWAYNWGIGNVLGGDAPPAETRLYAERIRHGAELLDLMLAAQEGD